MLTPPPNFGWTNVMCEMREYQWGGAASTVENGTLNQVNDFQNHQSWNVPGYMGEFNDFANGTDVWEFTTNPYNINWTVCAYKSSQGNWGLCETKSNLLPVPNVQSNSATTIAADWSQCTTANGCVLNPTLAPALSSVNSSFNSSAWYNVVNQAWRLIQQPRLIHQSMDINQDALRHMGR